MTFGFQSAVDIAANVLDCIHTTATSHGRVFIVEVMGHKVGWLTLHAGIAGGADIILLPELPYDLKRVASALDKRRRRGKAFSILAVAEGGRSPPGGQNGEKRSWRPPGGGGYPLRGLPFSGRASEPGRREVRVCVPGHFSAGRPALSL